MVDFSIDVNHSIPGGPNSGRYTVVNLSDFDLTLADTDVVSSELSGAAYSVTQMQNLPNLPVASVDATRTMRTL